MVNKYMTQKVNSNNFQAIGRERSGVYTCHVITGDNDPVMEARVFVEVLPDNDYGDSSSISHKSQKRISSQEKPNTGTEEMKTPSHTPVKVDKVMASENVDLSGKVSSNYSEEEPEDEIPSKAEIALLVSNSMKIIFRQLSDIDQRLKHIENKVLNEQ